MFPPSFPATPFKNGDPAEHLVDPLPFSKFGRRFNLPAERRKEGCTLWKYKIGGSKSELKSDPT